MNIVLYITTIAVWGSTWLAIQYQLGTVPVEVSIFYRFAIASLLLFGWCLYRKLNLRYSLKSHLFLMGQGVFLFSINYICAYSAGAYIASGLNAIGFSMVLLFNIINSAIFYRTPITLPVFLGALCGALGIGAIFWPALETLDLSNESLIGIGLSLGGGVLASFGNMISARNQQHQIPVTQSNAYAMAYGSLALFLVIATTDISFAFDWSYGYVFSLLHLAVSGSVIAFGCYLTLLGRIGANKAAYTLILVPVMALVVSTIFEDFHWTTHVFVGVGLILAGNVILLLKSPRQLVMSWKDKMRRRAIQIQSAEEGA